VHEAYLLFLDSGLSYKRQVVQTDSSSTPQVRIRLRKFPWLSVFPNCESRFPIMVLVADPLVEGQLAGDRLVGDPLAEGQLAEDRLVGDPLVAGQSGEDRWVEGWSA
jgi:hypothetical protein